jgi:hypothetical protein
MPQSESEPAGGWIYSYGGGDGHAIVFDDSFEHEVIHRGSEDRCVRACVLSCRTGERAGAWAGGIVGEFCFNFIYKRSFSLRCNGALELFQLIVMYVRRA